MLHFCPSLPLGVGGWVFFFSLFSAIGSGFLLRWHALCKPYCPMEGTSVGLVVVGLGSTGSSLVTGLLGARENLVRPHGSLVASLREKAPFAALHDFALGAFELQ